MKNKKDRARLAAQLAYPQLTDAANQRFEKALSILPPLPDGTQKRGVRRLCALKILRMSAGAVAAAVILLFGLNLTFPTVAESIPGLGQLFKTLNYKEAMGSNSPTYENLIQPVGESAETTDYSIAVREAYSEGQYVFLSLAMTSTNSLVNQAQWLSPMFLYDDSIPGPKREYRAIVNGQEAEFSRDLVLDKKGDAFEGVAIIKLPQEAKNGEVLQLELEIDALRGLYPETVNRHETPPDVEVEEKLTLPFTVTVNTAYNTQAAPGVVQDGVTFVRYESTPSYFRVVLEYPGLSSVYSAEGETGWMDARTEDGTALAYNTQGIEDSGENRAAMGEPLRHLGIFDGVPSGTKKVIVTLRNINTEGGTYGPEGGSMGSCVLGEFTVDLEEKTAVPTETYRQQGYQYCPVADYVALYEDSPIFKNHIFTTDSVLIGFKDIPPGEPDVPVAALSFSFYTDGGEPEMELGVYLDGKEVGTVPIRQETDSTTKPNSYFTQREAYSVYFTEAGPAAMEKEGRNGRLNRQFYVTYYLPEFSGDAYWEIDNHEVDFRLRDAATGTVLHDSADPKPDHYLNPNWL